MAREMQQAKDELFISCDYLAIHKSTSTIILEGNYGMLAANIIQKQSISIEILVRSKIGFWSKDENVEEQLKIMGMNALYDFEGIGGFTYGEYPSLYKRGE